MALSSGTTLGTFEIIGILGKGGMGEVYSAKDLKLGRTVAIKVLHGDVQKDQELMARFAREAQTLAALNHPNIATVHDFEHDSEHDFLYLVMEYIDGDTLSDRIRAKALTFQEAVPLFIQIARGLDVAHESGIVHRDLKPDNIKINEDGIVKILDFGLAKNTLEVQTIDPDAPTTPMSPLALTAEGTFMGTPMYMSPEQARGKVVDKRTDIWAFGCCLYEALSGDLPFQGNTVPDMVSKILEREPDWNKLPDDLPIPIRDLTIRCLQKDIRQRARDIGDICKTLEDFSTDSGKYAQISEQKIDSAKPPKSKIVLISTVAAVLGALIATAATSIYRPQNAVP